MATTTKQQQDDLELEVKNLLEDPFNPKPSLLIEKHVNYCMQNLHRLEFAYVSLDSSRPWLVYWALHSLCLLRCIDNLPSSVQNNTIDFLRRCQDKSRGGYAGSPQQYPHLASTYASVLALLTLGTEESYKSIDRSSVYKFLMSMKQEDGSFRLSLHGERDIRGVYLSLSVATLLNIITPELTNKCSEWIKSCQTYEGGFGGEPGYEAHGGYTFCGVSSLILLGKLCTNSTPTINIKSLLRWMMNKQKRFEGGFQGRTNKLVDGCYSFWVGSLFPLLVVYLPILKNKSKDKKDNLEKEKLKPNPKSELNLNTDIDGDININSTHVLYNISRLCFDSEALQRFILKCCQNTGGGFRSRPPVYPDLMHTAYCLSGLSIAQHFPVDSRIYGLDTNELLPVNPVFNIEQEKANNALLYFSKYPFPSI